MAAGPRSNALDFLGANLMHRHVASLTWSRAWRLVYPLARVLFARRTRHASCTFCTSNHKPKWHAIFIELKTPCPFELAQPTSRSTTYTTQKLIFSQNLTSTLELNYYKFITQMKILSSIKVFQNVLSFLPQNFSFQFQRMNSTTFMKSTLFRITYIMTFLAFFNLNSIHPYSN